jgi:hypothetical protein
MPQTQAPLIVGKSFIIDEVTPAIEALMRQLENREIVIEELGYRAIEHVKDRYSNQGYAHRFGGGPQPEWEPIHEVTKKFRRVRFGVEDEIIWFRTGEALRGIQEIKRGFDHIMIGWPDGMFPRNYPYRVDGGVKKTGGMIPGKSISARPLLYITMAFCNQAVRVVARWWLSAIGVSRYEEV